MKKIRVKNYSNIFIGEYPFHQKLKDELVPLLEKYPDRIPIICERAKMCNDKTIQDLDKRKFTEGTVVSATISEIGEKFIFCDLGLKSEGAIPAEEFKLTKEIDNIKV